MTFRLLILGSGLLIAGQGYAQDDCLKAPDANVASVVRTQIGLKRAKLCYDVKTHTPASLAGTVTLLEKADKEQALAERRRTITSLLEAMRQWAETGLGDATQRESLQRSLHEASTAVAAGELSKGIVDPTSWRIVERPKDRALLSNISGATDLALPIDAACTGADPKPCTAAVADLEAVLRSYALVEVALLVARREELTDFAELFAKRASMWDAYRTEARPQYPWEWLLNGVLYRDERRKDRNGNPIGPAALPKGQWIALHPGVGLERFDIRNTDQSANNPTLYIEWLGYNRLNWDYDVGKLRGGLGVSLVSVYAPRQDAKDWSNGVMFWVANKYGLAVTRNTEGTSVMVSIDVGELFRDQLNQFNQALRGGLPSK